MRIGACSMDGKTCGAVAGAWCRKHLPSLPQPKSPNLIQKRASQILRFIIIIFVRFRPVWRIQMIFNIDLFSRRRSNAEVSKIVKETPGVSIIKLHTIIISLGQSVNHKLPTLCSHTEAFNESGSRESMMSARKMSTA